MEAAGGLWQRRAGPEERRLLVSLSYGMVGMGALSALLLRFVWMPYGRYSTRRLGCLVPARLAWLLQELPALLVPLGLSLFSGAARVSEWPNRVLLALFIGHYAHRALIFPFLIRGGKPTPFITFTLALIFCVYNGYLQGRSLSNYAEYPSGWLKGPCFIVGFAGWLSGMIINIYSDHILRNLRKPGETGYKIPRASALSRTAPASPSQRLAMIRRRKKKTRDEMFAELMACSRAEAAEQKHWRETLCEQHRTLMEREDRWRQEDQQTTQTLLGLMKEQTDTLRRLVDVLQDRRLEDRAPLQCLCNRPPPPRSPGPPSPKSTRRRGGRGRENCH